MSEQLRVVRADRRRRTSRLIAQGTLSELVARAAGGGLRGDDLVFGLSPRARLVREVGALAPHVPCAEEAGLTASLRASRIAALLLLPIGVVAFVIGDRDAIVRSLGNIGTDDYELLYGLIVVPLSGLAYALAQRRRLRILRRVGAADDVQRLRDPGS